MGGIIRSWRPVWISPCDIAGTEVLNGAAEAVAVF